MDIKEALDILGLPKTSSAEEFKSKYKDLAKKYHPDIYKEDPEKFKKINEAYQLIQDYQANPAKYDNPSPFFRRTPFEDMGNIWNTININDIFGSQQQNSRTFKHPPINEQVSIAFKDSVLGINKEINFKKFSMCSDCNGNGSESIGNGCTNCNGFGRIMTNSKGMIFTTSCNKCYGRNITFKDCNKCNKNGVLEVNSNITIHIPPGTQNNSVLRLRGAGHYVGSGPFGETHTDVFVYVGVISDPDLLLDGPNVLTNLRISLLEAITGCTKNVKTIYDTRQIIIPAQSKHKDEIHIKDCGVKEANGVERVILNVEYPSNVDELTKFLQRN